MKRPGSDPWFITRQAYLPILVKALPYGLWRDGKSSCTYSVVLTPRPQVSQNGLGHVLGHVKDVGDDASQIDKIRIYRTNARQFFHADDSDLVGLLCIHRALEGGESDLVSSHRVWNVLQEERPDVARTLTEPTWYFDRKGEVSAGQQEWIKTSVFYKEPGTDGRVYSKWDPYFVRSLSRFSDKGEYSYRGCGIPKLTSALRHHPAPVAGTGRSCSRFRSNMRP